MAARVELRNGRQVFGDRDKTINVGSQKSWHTSLVSKTLRLVVLGLALAAASAFALAVVGGAWWSIAGVEVGPHGSQHCMGGADFCGLEWLGAGYDWQRLGTTVWGTGLVAALVLLILAATVAAKRGPRLLGIVAITSSLTTAVIGTLFVVRFPGFPSAHLDRGIWLFAIGVFFGLAAGLAVVRSATLTAKAAHHAAARNLAAAKRAAESA